MDNLIKFNKIMLSCLFKKKKKIAKGLDHTILATGSCGPTPVLGIHGINKNPVLYA